MDAHLVCKRQVRVAFGSQICHNKSGEINPAKIQALVEAYVKKFRKKRKLGLA